MMAVNKPVRHSIATDEEGATLVEYGLLLGFVAVLAVLAVAAVGQDVFEVFDATHQELGGTIEPSIPTP